MYYNKKINFIFVMLVLTILLSGTGYTSDEKINLNFKAVDLRDALRTIAEYAEVNLIADESVQGKITINLKDLSFKNALKLISESSGLGWEYKNNTFFVAKESRIHDLFSVFTLKKIEIKNRDVKEVKLILKGIYPELQISADLKNNNLFLRGEIKKLKEIEELILLIDQKLPVINEIKDFEFIEVNNNNNLEEILKTIKLLYPDVNSIILKENNKILIYGNSEKNKEIKNIIKNNFQNKINQNKYKHSLIIDKLLFEQLKKIINKFENGVDYFYENKSGILYLEGKKGDIEFLLALLKKIKENRKPIYITKNKNLEYIDIKSVENLKKKIFPEIKLYSNFKRSLITIKGEKNKIREFINILEEIDKPRIQVMIEAQILEVSFRELKELGVNPGDLSRIKILDKKELDIDIELAEMFKLLKENGSAKVLASPTLMTVEGEKAELLIGDKIPMKIDKDDHEEIKYIEAGIKLQFLPLVTTNNEILLEVNPRVSSLGESISGSLPSINTREVSTNVRLKNRETFIIAGLIQEDIIKSKIKVPVLGDIPVLGNIFKSYEKSTRQNEVIIMLKPYIIENTHIKKDNYPQKEGKFRISIEEYNVWKEKMENLKF